MDDRKREHVKCEKKERQREDWGQAVAEKLSFTLVNKQGGWGGVGAECHPTILAPQIIDTV